MKKEKNYLWILAFIIIPILGLIGYFNNPNITMQRYSQNNPYCPEELYNEFVIKFVNDGARGGTLKVSIDSDDFNFIDKKDNLYIISDKDKKTTFHFKLNATKQASSINNSLSYTYTYNKFIFIPISFTNYCAYTTDKTGKFVLIK